MDSIHHNGFIPSVDTKQNLDNIQDPSAKVDGKDGMHTVAVVIPSSSSAFERPTIRVRTAPASLGDHTITQESYVPLENFKTAFAADPRATRFVIYPDGTVHAASEMPGVDGAGIKKSENRSFNKALRAALARELPLEAGTLFPPQEVSEILGGVPLSSERLHLIRARLCEGDQPIVLSSSEPAQTISSNNTKPLESQSMGAKFLEVMHLGHLKDPDPKKKEYEKRCYEMLQEAKRIHPQFEKFADQWLQASPKKIVALLHEIDATDARPEEKKAVKTKLFLAKQLNNATQALNTAVAHRNRFALALEAARPNSDDTKQEERDRSLRLSFYASKIDSVNKTIAQLENAAQSIMESAERSIDYSERMSSAFESSNPNHNYGMTDEIDALIQALSLEDMSMDSNVHFVEVIRQRDLLADIDDAQAGELATRYTQEARADLSAAARFSQAATLFSQAATYYTQEAEAPVIENDALSFRSLWHDAALSAFRGAAAISNNRPEIATYYTKASSYYKNAVTAKEAGNTALTKLLRYAAGTSVQIAEAANNNQRELSAQYSETVLYFENAIQAVEQNKPHVTLLWDNAGEASLRGIEASVNNQTEVAEFYRNAVACYKNGATAAVNNEEVFTELWRRAGAAFFLAAEAAANNHPEVTARYTDAAFCFKNVIEITNAADLSEEKKKTISDLWYNAGVSAVRAANGIVNTQQEAASRYTEASSYYKSAAEATAEGKDDLALSFQKAAISFLQAAEAKEVHI
ncbi:MAG: hypothetical protein A3F67_01635 [Verrucomicrobia bacterium RIFCSPHIGHO2_12_FULL_41_10]|nr:MAG: hypothetical protein A3F67_01635 [Verrucomicrobia bacterium RIFCSPHIGHO2_12_FULL_41_10]HLB33120.1 hypothetical protein [Chthoniobacterales bacterium]